MSPIVEAAGQTSPGRVRSSHAFTFFGPNLGKRRLAATTASATSAAVRCGQLAAAWLRSQNHAGSPDARRARST